ncbi:FAD-dependent oxidoreductase [Streptomyces purpureus]|uniref:FAD-dependent oxidoreductase n=1 Tax=Streptomyces purpureus TaxID=1951 RepID=UPI0027E3B9B5|nr:FAD-dependent oxidoreductase [Streptomyces purpureus]
MTTDTGRHLTYDRPVYALGTRTAEPAAPGPGRATRAYSADTAAELHKHLQDRPGSVAVVGGCLTGIEMAAKLAETYGSRPGLSVRPLTGSRVGLGLSSRGRSHVIRVLAARGVRIEKGRHVTHPDDVDADVDTGLATSAGLTRALGPDRRGRVSASGLPPRGVRAR